MNSSPSLSQLIKTIQKLRSDEGCPWDKRQTNMSMLKYLQSECDELIDAIKNDDTENICEELGDLLYIIAMLSEINAEQKSFTFDDVLEGINEKLIRRHPHVFAGKPFKDEAELHKQWQEIKAMEKLSKSV